jgi:phage host-nuclease inhibitor protein Gam
MRKSLIFSLAGLVAFSFAASLPAQTQEKSKTATKSAGNTGVDSTRKAADTSKDAKDYRRVPQYFGQVGLSDDQHEKIYSIREKYAIQQAKLEEELASMQDKIMRECEAVLLPEQRNELTKLRGEAKAKAKAKSKAKSATKKG